jgi:hypothetical protein
VCDRGPKPDSGVTCGNVVITGGQSHHNWYL